MQAPEYDDFVDVWCQAWELYGKSVSPGALELCFAALQRFELSAITRALTAHVNDPDSGQYPPKPADIVRLIEGRKEDRAYAAWTKVEHTARRVGQYDTVVFDDPIIHAVIHDMGGWVDVCMTEEEELPFKAREFVKRYQGYLIRGGAERFLRQLTGRIDQVNHATGHGDRKQELVLIGDPEQAQLTHQRGGDQSAVTFTRLSRNPQLRDLKQLYGPPDSEREDAA